MTDQPITVTEAIAALEREIESLGTWTKWDGPTADHYKRYRAALEYLRDELHPWAGLEDITYLRDGKRLHAAVAPIVARWREEDKR